MTRFVLWFTLMALCGVAGVQLLGHQHGRLGMLALLAAVVACIQLMFVCAQANDHQYR